MADINITIIIPEVQIERVQKILQVYPIPLDSESNPIYTQKQWFKKIIVRYIKGLVQQVERNEAEQLARDNISDVDIME